MLTEEQLEALTTRLENKLRAGWRAMIRGIKDENALAAIEAKVARYEVGNLVEGIEGAVKQFTADLADGYSFAGRTAARHIDAQISRAFRFDLVDPDVQQWMRGTADAIARPLVEEQAAVARRVWQQGMRRGFTPRMIAEEIQGSIGLNVQQVDQVYRYRDLLEAQDFRRAMTYQLADGRYDIALARAARDRTPFSRERINSMVSKYRDNWVRHRSNVVALTEAQNATHAGVEEATKQAVDQRFIPRTAVVRVWITRGDHKVRDSHAPMHGQQRAIGEPFVSGYGNRLMFPGDRNAPIGERVHCRCKVRIEFVKTTAPAKPVAPRS